MKFDLQPWKVHASFVWSSKAQHCICAKIFANIKILYCTVFGYHAVLREAIGPDPLVVLVAYSITHIKVIETSSLHSDVGDSTPSGCRRSLR